MSQVRRDVQGVELLREVTGIEPAEYDRQQAADAAGVKNVAIFLTELSSRQAHSTLMISKQQVMKLRHKVCDQKVMTAGDAALQLGTCLEARSNTLPCIDEPCIVCACFRCSPAN